MIGFFTYSKHHTKINGSLIYKLEVTLRLRVKVLIRQWWKHKRPERLWRESVPWQNRLDHVCPNSEMEIVVIPTFQVLSPICIQSQEFEWGKWISSSMKLQKTWHKFPMKSHLSQCHNVVYWLDNAATQFYLASIQKHFVAMGWVCYTLSFKKLHLYLLQKSSFHLTSAQSLFCYQFATPCYWKTHSCKYIHLFKIQDTTTFC